MRNLTYAQAIHEAIDLCLERDSRVLVMGEGIADYKGVFGTTVGLVEKYGLERIIDTPVSENGVTGVCIGAAICGMRPILVHQRIDFSLYSADQIINTAAKWYFMFGGKQSVPMVIRMIIGRGWGQGSQHSQSLAALYGHIPGLTVVLPSSPSDAKGMLISAVESPNPVIIIEHRWLHSITGQVEKGYYRTPLGTAQKLRKGKDVTIVSVSYMTIEALRAYAILRKEGVSAEIIDLGSIRPLDYQPIISSVSKTGRLLVADTAVCHLGVSAEVIARVCESGVKQHYPPMRLGMKDVPMPTSWYLAKSIYPTHIDIVRKVFFMMGHDKVEHIMRKYIKEEGFQDVPDSSFLGPF